MTTTKEQRLIDESCGNGSAERLQKTKRHTFIAIGLLLAAQATAIGLLVSMVLSGSTRAAYITDVMQNVQAILCISEHPVQERSPEIIEECKKRAEKRDGSSTE